MTRARIPPLRIAAWVLAGAIGWAGLVWIGALLASLDPPRAGDDLRVLVDAASRIVVGDALYVVLPTGSSLEAESLFYSYPPPVAQAVTLVSWMPFGVILVLWGAGAAAGLALVARLIGRLTAGLVLPVIALAPYIVAFAVALLFGNIDAWFPLAYGLALVAVLAPGRRAAAAGGIALAGATVAKLHPASLVLWLAVLAARQGRERAEVGILIAVACGVAAIIAASLLVWGVQPWVDYADFIRSGAVASDLTNPLNIGPASQISLAFGLDSAAARSVQVIVTASALAVTIGAAWLVRDPVTSFGWAATASMVVLPVTWVHYPVALLPVAIAAAARSSTGGVWLVRSLLLGAVVAGMIAVARPPIMWVAVALVLAAAVASRPDTAKPSRGGTLPARTI